MRIESAVSSVSPAASRHLHLRDGRRADTSSATRRRPTRGSDRSAAPPTGRVAKRRLGDDHRQQGDHDHHEHEEPRAACGACRGHVSALLACARRILVKVIFIEVIPGSARLHAADSRPIVRTGLDRAEVLLAVQAVNWYDCQRCQTGENARRRRMPDWIPNRWIIDVADTVSEAPLLVAKALEDIPGCCDILRLNPDDLGDLAGEQPRAELQCPIVVAACFEECERFVNDVVGGDERLAIVPVNRRPVWAWAIAGLPTQGCAWAVECRPQGSSNLELSREILVPAQLCRGSESESLAATVLSSKLNVWRRTAQPAPERPRGGVILPAHQADPQQAVGSSGSGTTASKTGLSGRARRRRPSCVGSSPPCRLDRCAGLVFQVSRSTPFRSCST